MIAAIVPKILPTIIQSPEVDVDSRHHALERQDTQRNAPEMLKHFKEAEFLWYQFKSSFSSCPFTHL